MEQNIIKNSFKYSFFRTIPMLIGFFPVGVAFGILMYEVGYNFLWTAGVSIFVFAGSLQMLMISFFEGGIDYVTIFVMALLLNSRHIFYGISFIEKFRSYGKWKYMLIYALTDENYSLMCSYEDRQDVSEKWVTIFSTMLQWIYWVGFTIIGTLIGRFIFFDTTGIDFALTALFVVILVEQIRNAETKKPLYIGAISSVINLIILGADKFLLPSLIITVVLLIIFRKNIEIEKGEE